MTGVRGISQNEFGNFDGPKRIYELSWQLVMANRGEIYRGRDCSHEVKRIRYFSEKCGKMNIVDSDWRFHNLCGSHLQSQKMTTAQVVETSVTANNNSPIQD